MMIDGILIEKKVGIVIKFPSTSEKAVVNEWKLMNKFTIGM